MPDETDKQIANRIHAIFPSKEIASRVTNLVITTKPIGTSKRAYYPYYNEKHALRIKGAIDKMIVTRDSVIYRYAEFCEGASSMSEGTLYNMVSQSIRYLVDCMDDTSMKYYEWRQCVRVNRSKTRGGVCIDFRPEFRDPNKEFVGELCVAPSDGTPQWRIDIDTWLEGDSVKPFIREHLTLSGPEVVELKMEIKELKGIMGSIDACSIKLMKVSV